jgi:fumarate hydratase subunit alpha
LQKGLEEEISPAGKAVFRELLENARIAGEEKIPICQDTGFAVLFVEMGQELHFVGGDFNEAIHEGVRQGYLDGFLRKSIVKILSAERIQGITLPPLFIWKLYRVISLN